MNRPARGLCFAVNRDANTPQPRLTIDLSGLPGLPGLGTPRAQQGDNCCMRTIRTAPTPPEAPEGRHAATGSTLQ